MASWHGTHDWQVGEIPTAGELNEFISDNMQWLYDTLLTKVAASCSVIVPSSPTAYNPGSFADVAGMSTVITAGASNNDTVFGFAQMMGTVTPGGAVQFQWAVDGGRVGQWAALYRVDGSAINLGTMPVVFAVNSLTAGAHTFSMQAEGSGGGEVNRINCVGVLVHVKR